MGKIITLSEAYIRKCLKKELIAALDELEAAEIAFRNDDSYQLIKVTTRLFAARERVDQLTKEIKEVQ